MGKELKVRNAVLDGEVAAVDESGMPAFYDLMKRKRQAVYFAFDLLWLDGKDLRDLPLLERKESPTLGHPSKVFVDWLRELR